MMSIDELMMVGRGKLKATMNELRKEYRYRKKRAMVCWVFGKLRRKSAVPLLLKALKDDDKFVRHEAALALGRIGDERAVKALTRSMLSDVEKKVREECVEALSRFKGKDIRSAIRKALSDRSEIVRRAARKVLSQYS